MVIKRVGEKWLCKCDCGNEISAYSWNLRKEKTKSCGCLNSEATTLRNTKHGMSRDPMYAMWKGMLDRCEHKQQSGYKNYGGRGIKVCEEWHSIKTFIEWAHSHGYHKGLFIDRIDNNGNYEPANCRWADATTQANNRRDNIRLEHNGRSQTLTQWAAELGVCRSSLRQRIVDKHWDVDTAFETPYIHRSRRERK